MKITKTQVGAEVCHEKLLSFVGEFHKDRQKELIDVTSVDFDFTTIKDMGHRWKGFSKPYGFHILAEIGTELENEAELRNDQRIRLLLADAQTYLDIKKEFIG